MFKNLTLTQNIGYGTLLFGMALIFIALLESVQFYFIDIILAVLCLVMVIPTFFLIRRSYEEIDEMAEKYIGKAAIVTIHFMAALWSICIFCMHFIDYTKISPLSLLTDFLGLSLIVFVCLYVYLEKEGD